MRRPATVVIALITMLALSASSVHAGGLRESAHAAATHATQVPAQRGPMPTGLKWTGIGLLIGGGVTILLGAAIKSDGGCGYGYSYASDDCEAIGTGFYVLGAGMAGTGAALLGVANAKRERLPSVTFQRGRVAVRQRITF